MEKLDATETKETRTRRKLRVDKPQSPIEKSNPVDPVAQVREKDKVSQLAELSPRKNALEKKTKVQ